MNTYISILYWSELIITSISLDIAIMAIFNELAKYFCVDMPTWGNIGSAGSRIKGLLKTYSACTMTVSDMFISYLEKDVLPQMINNNIFYSICCLLLIVNITYLIYSIPKMFKIRKTELKHHNN